MATKKKAVKKAVKKMAETLAESLAKHSLTKHTNEHVGQSLRLASELLAQAKKHDSAIAPKHHQLMRAGRILQTLGELLMCERAVVLYHRTGAVAEEGDSAKRVAELERWLASSMGER